MSCLVLIILFIQSLKQKQQHWLLWKVYVSGRGYDNEWIEKDSTDLLNTYLWYNFNNKSQNLNFQFRKNIYRLFTVCISVCNLRWVYKLATDSRWVYLKIVINLNTCRFVLFGVNHTVYSITETKTTTLTLMKGIRLRPRIR